MNRYDNWILTNAGKHFNFEAPNAKDISIHDIALSLSRTCRYNGHCNRFYSVTDHILNGREHIDPKLLKYWDLHDAEEAYIGDIPTPLKKMLGPEFKAVQQAVHKAICERFDLNPDFAPEVKENDLRMLLAEREVLFEAKHLAEPWNIDYSIKLDDLEIPYEHVVIKHRHPAVSLDLYREILESYG